MKWSRKIRHFWHEVFYWRSSRRRVEFGLRCVDVTRDIDLRHKSSKLTERFRFQLHLSLCQTCHDYERLTTALRQALKEKSISINNVDLEALNKNLLKKYSRSRKEF